MPSTSSTSIYVPRRQTATVAYKIFKPFEGSSRHYTAMIIISSNTFNTALNFDAILSRLHFPYIGVRSIHVIEQEIGTLRQVNPTLLR